MKILTGRFVCRYCGWPVQEPGEHTAGSCCGEAFDHVAIAVDECAVEGCDQDALPESAFCNHHQDEAR